MSTDIQNQRWILRKLPAWARPYGILARIDRPVGIWLLLLPGLWGIVLASGAQGGVSFKTFLMAILFTLGALVMRSAGCVINDLWDRKLDACVERTSARPLASGEITVFQALLFLLALLMSGFCILLLMNGTTIVLGLFSVPLIVLYPLMKRITFWPQAMLGLTFNFGALMGWSAITGQIGLTAILLYAAGILWTLGYDTIYAHQDREDDALIGIKSTALKFGSQSKLWVARFYAGTCGFLLLTMLLSGQNIYAYGGLLLIIAHLAWQIWRWDIQDPASALRMFKSNRDFGLIVLSTFIVGVF